MKKSIEAKEEFFHIKNDTLFSNSLKLKKGDKDFPLNGITGITIEILPDEPARISLHYLLQDMDIIAKEKKNGSKLRK